MYSVNCMPRYGPSTSVTLAIGPEGGFEPSEIAALDAAGFVPVSLGANVLRFETAAIAGVAAVRAALDANPVPSRDEA